jgi:hypothetical protein
MAQKAIREVDGKRLLSQWLPKAWSEEAFNGADVTPLQALRDRRAFGVAAPAGGGPIAWDTVVARCALTRRRHTRLVVLMSLPIRAHACVLLPRRRASLVPAAAWSRGRHTQLRVIASAVVVSPWACVGLEASRAVAR